MNTYKPLKYYEYIVQGNVKDAVSYLEQFPIMSRRVKKYYSVFEGGEVLVRSKNSKINEIDAIFQKYYIKVFWEGIDRKKALKYLCIEFCKKFDLLIPQEESNEVLEQFWDDVIEERLKNAVEKEGYYYCGGTTQGYYGPYIWSKSILKTYKVKLPSGYTNFSVNMLSEFVSRSWMDFISFEKIGTGGWAGKDGIINCVWKVYRKRILLPSFYIDFLKHEAQHSIDLQRFDGISSVHLEYRAKLVQLIYARNMKTFNKFLSEADSTDKKNSHTYASYLIIHNLSKRIFNEDYVEDPKKWKRYLKTINKNSLEVFNEYPAGVEEIQ